MEKQRKMINLKDLTENQKFLLEQKYPYENYEDDAISINLGKKVVHAVVLETEDVVYLIKFSSENQKVKPEKIEGLSIQQQSFFDDEN